MKTNLSFWTSHNVAVVHIGFKWYPGHTSISLKIVDDHDYLLKQMTVDTLGRVCVEAVEFAEAWCRIVVKLTECLR